MTTANGPAWKSVISGNLQAVVYLPKISLLAMPTDNGALSVAHISPTLQIMSLHLTLKEPPHNGLQASLKLNPVLVAIRGFIGHFHSYQCKREGLAYISELHITAQDIKHKAKFWSVKI